MPYESVKSDVHPQKVGNHERFTGQFKSQRGIHFGGTVSRKDVLLTNMCASDDRPLDLRSPNNIRVLDLSQSHKNEAPDVQTATKEKNTKDSNFVNYQNEFASKIKSSKAISISCEESNLIGHRTGVVRNYANSLAPTSVESKHTISSNALQRLKQESTGVSSNCVPISSKKRSYQQTCQYPEKYQTNSDKSKNRKRSRPLEQLEKMTLSRFVAPGHESSIKHEELSNSLQHFYGQTNNLTHVNPLPKITPGSGMERLPIIPGTQLLGPIPHPQMKGNYVVQHCADLKRVSNGQHVKPQFPGSDLQHKLKDTREGYAHPCVVVQNRAEIIYTRGNEGNHKMSPHDMANRIPTTLQDIVQHEKHFTTGRIDSAYSYPTTNRSMIRNNPPKEQGMPPLHYLVDTTQPVNQHLEVDAAKVPIIEQLQTPNVEMHSNQSEIISLLQRSHKDYFSGHQPKIQNTPMVSCDPNHANEVGTFSEFHTNEDLLVRGHDGVPMYCHKRPHYVLPKGCSSLQDQHIQQILQQSRAAQIHTEFLSTQLKTLSHHYIQNQGVSVHQHVPQKFQGYPSDTANHPIHALQEANSTSRHLPVKEQTTYKSNPKTVDNTVPTGIPRALPPGVCADGQLVFITCDQCDNRANFLCSQCKKVAYCSQECQNTAWTYHKNLCDT